MASSKGCVLICAITGILLWGGSFYWLYFASISVWDVATANPKILISQPTKGYVWESISKNATKFCDNKTKFLPSSCHANTGDKFDKKDDPKCQCDLCNCDSDDSEYTQCDMETNLNRMWSASRMHFVMHCIDMGHFLLLAIVAFGGIAPLARYCSFYFSARVIVTIVNAALQTAWYDGYARASAAWEREVFPDYWHGNMCDFPHGTAADEVYKPRVLFSVWFIAAVNCIICLYPYATFSAAFAAELEAAAEAEGAEEGGGDDGEGGGEVANFDKGDGGGGYGGGGDYGAKTCCTSSSSYQSSYQQSVAYQ